jgi:membrane protein
MPIRKIDRRIPKPMRPAWRAARRTVANYLDEEGLQWSGAVAFYLVLSVPPLLIAAVSIGVVVVGADAAQSFLVGQVQQFLPAQDEIIADIVEQTVNASGPAALVAVGFLLFSGSRVFASLIAAINIMWQEIESPGFWRRQVERVAMVVTVGALLALAGVVDVAIAIAIDLLDLPVAVRLVAQSQLIPLLFLGTGLFLLYFLIPRRAATWRTALLGAVVAAVGLRVAQAGFTAYLATFGAFGSAYGPIAGLAVVLTWALVASAIILLGAHLVAVLNSPDREPRREARPDHQLPGQPEASRRPRPHRRDEEAPGAGVEVQHLSSAHGRKRDPDSAARLSR